MYSCRYNIYRLLFYLTVLLIFPLCLKSQPRLKASYYFMENGMPTNVIQSCTTDSLGYLWLSTSKGLCRYDGFLFEPVHGVKDYSYNISVNSNGILYYYSRAGLSSINPYTYNSEVVSPADFQDSDPNNDDYDNLFVDKEGRVWCNDFRYVKYFIPGTSNTRKFIISQYNSNATTLAKFCSSTRGQVWIAAYNGLYIWNSVSDSLQLCSNPLLSRLSYSSCVRWDDDTLVLVSGNQIYLIRASTSSIIQKATIPVGEAESILSMQIANFKGKKSLFLASRGRIFSCGEDFKSFVTIFSINNKIGTINSIYIPTDSRNVWVCTNNGLVKLTPESEAVTNYMLPGYAPQENHVTTIAQSLARDLFFVGTSGGQFYSTNLKDRWPYISMPGGIGINHAANCNNQILLCTTKGLYSCHNMRLKKVSLNPIYDSASIKKALVTERHIWLLADKLPVMILNKENYKIAPEISMQHNDIFSLNNDWNDIAEDASGGIYLAGWIPDDYGLAKYDPDSAAFVRVSHRTTNRSFFMGDYFNRVSVSERYNLVFSGYGGLNILNKNGEVIHKFTPNLYPLLNEDVFGNVVMENGSIWFGTPDGIQQWDPATNGISSFTTFNGLPFNNALYAFEKLPGDILAVGFNHSFSFINTTNIAKEEPITMLEVSKILINNSERKVTNRQIILHPGERNITLYFSTLSFSDYYAIHYAYRIDGKEWQSLGNNPYVHFGNLKNGKYALEIKAANALQPQQEKFLLVQIVALPFFYETLWFKLLVGLFLCALVLLFVRGREKSFKTIASEKLKVQQLSAERYKSKLELERIINYFSSSLTNKTKVEEVLWDTAKNLIGRIGFVDCMIYLWNDDKTKMIQKAGFGPKGSIEEIKKQHFDVLPGQGVVGYVMETREPVVIPDTSKDSRYRPDEMVRLSEITVPVIYNNELMGIIDSEHHERNFFTEQHLQIMITIAALMANKIKSIEAEQTLQETHIKMYGMNEQLLNAKLEALQSQMNPHFIFNCINSIDALIHSNDKYNATVYLNKFAKLIRNILDGSKQNTVTFSKDVETLKLYIELEELRNENKFKTFIEIDNTLVEGDYKVPPLIVQPFVENAILHGLRNKSDNGGILNVRIRKLNEKIQYLIADNGIGRVAAGKIKQNKESHLGMEMSFDRIRLFNAEETTSVNIKDLYVDGVAIGTEVTVNLNIV